MNVLILALVMAVSTSIVAHDGGHGPRLTESSVYGGVVAPVIRAEAVSLGRKASLIYKSELLRTEDGAVRVYLYTSQMKPLPLSNFEKKGKAILETKGKSGWEKREFELTLSGGVFIGKLPKVNIKKPYNIDVFVTASSQSYFVAFDNLD